MISDLSTSVWTGCGLSRIFKEINVCMCTWDFHYEFIFSLMPLRTRRIRCLSEAGKSWDANVMRHNKVEDAPCERDSIFVSFSSCQLARRPTRGVAGWDGGCCHGDRRPHVLRASLRSKEFIVLALSRLHPPSRPPSLPLSVHPTLDGNKQLVQPLGLQRCETHTHTLLRGHARPDVSGNKSHSERILYEWIKHQWAQSK